jgi:hypothetical protein
MTYQSEFDLSETLLISAEYLCRIGEKLDSLPIVPYESSLYIFAAPKWDG